MYTIYQIRYHLADLGIYETIILKWIGKHRFLSTQNGFI
jgi:hypothetical protein